MSLRNSLFLFLVFLFASAVVCAGPNPDRMKHGKPVVCPITKDYNVGDRGPANGWIIYKKPVASGQSEETCWQYLEAAPVDSPISVWSNVKDKLVGGTSTGVGNGQDNTKKIMAQAGHTASAAKVCNDLVVKYNGQTFKGWFLPSMDELDLMYQLLAKVDNKGGFATIYDKGTALYPRYWSSSEDAEDGAWGQGFVGGSQPGFFKSAHSNVRCARAF